MLDDVIAFVNESYQHKHVQHFERTLHWVLQLRPDADEALQIAAYAHDIERAHRSPEAVKMHSDSKQGYLDEDFLRYHQETGAKIMEDWLSDQGADQKLIDRVSHLISKHEVGGDADQDLLKDCDSISFFETNAERFVIEKAPVEGKEKVQMKFDWMFNRISSRQAREIAEHLYKKYSEELD